MIVGTRAILRNVIALRLRDSPRPQYLSGGDYSYAGVISTTDGRNLDDDSSMFPRRIVPDRANDSMANIRNHRVLTLAHYDFFIRKRFARSVHITLVRIMWQIATSIAR